MIKRLSSSSLSLMIAGITVLALSSCSRPDYVKIFHDPALYSRTVHELNSVVMGNNFTPVVASRNYAYATIAGYEVIAAGDPKHYQSLANQLNGLKAVPKPEKDQQIDYAYAALLAFCEVGEAVTFPEGSLKYYTDSLHTLAATHHMPDQMISGSEIYAKAVAKSILAWSKGDNYLKTRSASKFSINDSLGRWVPTPPMYAEAVEPHWGEIRTMVMHDAKEYSVPPPPKFDVTNKSSPYFLDVMRSKNAVDSLNAEQTHIADFWDDNPQKLNVSGHVMFITKKFSPPGHWLSIVGIGAKNVKADFNTTVAAYAKTAIALFDGFIESWAAKYIYKTARPETVIDKYIDADWRPHLQTPPFPEYTCGHCTISAAAAEALTSALGDNIAYKDTSEQEFGIKSRSYKSFRDAANENVMARFYGGIHFMNSCKVSNKYGRVVGDSVAIKLVMKKK
ncbi:vanadium-dependent haloperoxidase [Mucilaginibacter ginkgonis]|uniref:Vanadium-dependent haloperoxidase n=1 Tax=Mucilaginibacter ginkgonis TaxID=2682091 RepID=A0A6I4HXA0_9SPHI|nr:vanadium-dependent haloperoxidase [Mucilaginibacter ginkgonis]QQL51463.1 vanadium-dependent haloperoxidase [Mucilaginibacter ginkgonis]